MTLLGRSGSGKSTLLHAVAGLVPPAAGEIRLAGRSVASARSVLAPERRDVGLLFQSLALWPHLDALRTVAYPLRRAGQDRAAAETAAAMMLARLDLDRLARRRPGELSGGEPQRVALARALVRDCGVFLLDEPTAHLNAELRRTVHELVRERLALTGAACLFATHDAGEALAVADRVALLVDGRLVQVGTPSDVYAEPVSATAARLTGSASVLSVPVSRGAAGEPVVDFGGGARAVAGAAAVEDGERRRQVLLRPDWVSLDGPCRARVAGCEYRGSYTDYRLDTVFGTVHAQLSGPPRHALGASVGWTVRRAWVLPEDDPAPHDDDQPSAVMAPG
jgi:ABC-type Fe3+/spermidine/putrescine transport system ATPase subunit